MWTADKRWFLRLEARHRLTIPWRKGNTTSYQMSGSRIAGFCVDGNELLGVMKGRGCVHLSDHYLLEMDSAPWNWSVSLLVSSERVGDRDVVEARHVRTARKFPLLLTVL
jgi:hypothetical protein